LLGRQRLEPGGRETRAETAEQGLVFIFFVVVSWMVVDVGAMSGVAAVQSLDDRLIDNG
jgi:hypothetical protein